jgi:hypothetical protein
VAQRRHRQIHAPIGVVRTLQERLHAELKQLYRAHPHAHGFIDGRSVASNAADHAGKRWVLNIDLEDFFPTINFGRVRGLLLRPPFELGAPAAAVCAQIVTYRNGLPQGAPTSPVLPTSSPPPSRLLRSPASTSWNTHPCRRHHLPTDHRNSRRALPCASSSKGAA